MSDYVNRNDLRSLEYKVEQMIRSKVEEETGKIRRDLEYKIADTKQYVRSYTSDTMLCFIMYLVGIVLIAITIFS